MQIAQEELEPRVYLSKPLKLIGLDPRRSAGDPAKAPSLAASGRVRRGALASAHAPPAPLRRLGDRLGIKRRQGVHHPFGAGR